MKNSCLALFFYLILLSVAGQSLNVMTYNIRYDNPDDGINRWHNRKAIVKETIYSQNPDILGIQEGLLNQVEYLDSILPGYNYVGIGRDDGDKRGEFSALFFKKDKIELIRSSSFWFSETPDRPSVGWDASIVRICTWALLELKNKNEKIFVFNLHLDHIGKESRATSVDLLLDTIPVMNSENYPVIIMGDFNMTHGSKPIRKLKKSFFDSRYIPLENIIGPEGTFNGFDPEHPLSDRIDYIFISRNNFECKSYSTLNPVIDGVFGSDHLPVVAEITFKNDN
ncbi:MAG: endonuclease/exonuclease/phosphatase family protein [Bacteroidales bacterium]|nr:endonuclease/exonuclease/phosphatase family protein [Bacteroidales bacterium]